MPACLPSTPKRDIIGGGSARVAELADAPDLGSGPAMGGGSSPPFRTSVQVFRNNTPADAQGVGRRSNEAREASGWGGPALRDPPSAGNRFSNRVHRGGTRPDRCDVPDGRWVNALRDSASSKESPPAV